MIPPVDAVPNPRAARLAKGLVRCLPNWNIIKHIYVTGIIIISISQLTSLPTELLANPEVLLRGSYGIVALRGGD